MLLNILAEMMPKEVFYLAQDTVKARIQLKNDTEANWNKALNFVPLKGEIIIYSTDESHPFSRLKVGDGKTNVVQLPFINAEAADSRIINIATTAEWNKQLTFIPAKGDIILYTDKVELGNSTYAPGLKIGDGTTYCIDLPFLGDDVMETLLAHIQDTTSHITEAERQFWNNKINCKDSVDAETLILNRN